MIEAKKKHALDVISQACDEHRCKKVFCLYSGGDDSAAALRVAVEHPNFTAAVHCNTGIGVEATREHARQTCKELGVPLIEYRADENVTSRGKPDPQVYEEMVLTYGFPGPTKFGHGKMYSRLKDRGIRRLLREHTDKKENVVLASGCRADESTRRMGHAEWIHRGEPGLENGLPRLREPRRVWVNHLLDWTKTDTLALQAHHGMRRNPASALIGMSGECLCGAFATPGELDRLESHDLTRPVALRIRDLERKVLRAGFPWGWHERVPAWWLKLDGEQQDAWRLENATPENVGPMCQGCEVKRQMTGER